MITLLPDYEPFRRYPMGPQWEPLDEAPDYVRSRDATRWHRARSGKVYDSGRFVYSYWCGPNYGDYGQDVIGDDEDRCGTCEGRFIAQRENPWLFTPRKSLPPTLCPASGQMGMVPVPYERRFPCPVCGETVGTRAVSMYYSGAAVVRHLAGPGLIAPCRRHGWHSLVLHNRTAICACAVEAVPA